MEFKVFLDTNIFIDHLQDRNIHSTQVLRLCEQRAIEGFASSSCFYALAYFVSKYTKADIRKTLENYSEIVELIPTTKENLYGAYQSGFKDMEDAFQYFTARNKTDMDFFITNNLKDFKHTDKKLKVVSSSEFLKILSNEE
jgi:predicted nucleic acid-binding protein